MPNTRTVNITYAGVDLTSYPDKFRTHLPNSHYNFFEVPWNFSCPGYGILLVTSQQAAKIIQNVDPTAGSDLSLGIDSTDPAESVTLKGIIPVQSTLVWGEHMRSGGVSDKGEILSLADAADSFQTIDGLWAMEVQDLRNYWWRYAPSADNGYTYKGVFNVKLGDALFVEGTAKDTHTAWTLQELFQQLVPELNFEGIVANQTLYDVFLAGIPMPVAADLLLQNALIGRVFKYDPSEATRYNAVSLQDEIYSLVAPLQPYKLSGGFTMKHVGFPNEPQALVQRNKRSAKPDFSDYYQTSDSDNTKVGFMYQRDVNYSGGWGSSLTTGKHRDRNHYHAVYRGFLKAALKDTYPTSMVRFSWMSQIPTTEIHVGKSSPLRTMLEGPTGHWYADWPIRVSIDGQIGLPMRPRVGFLGTIKKCNAGAGWALVLPAGDVDNATNYVKTGFIKNTWHQSGDNVRVVPVDSQYGWEIDTEIDGFTCAPPQGATDVTCSPRDLCADSDS